MIDFSSLAGQLIGQVQAVVPVADIVTNYTNSIVALVVAFGTLGGLILKFVQSHDHSPRIASLETDMENMKTFAGEIKQVQPQITAVTTLATTAMPQLQQAANAHSTQIVSIQKDIDNLTAKINAIGQFFPNVAAAVTATPTATVADKPQSQQSTNIQ